jgi:hypothetical protein
MKTMEVQASTVDNALGVVYTKLREEHGEHETFWVTLDSVRITTNCVTVFTYIFKIIQERTEL